MHVTHHNAENQLYPDFPAITSRRCCADACDPSQRRKSIVSRFSSHHLSPLLLALGTIRLLVLLTLDAFRLEGLPLLRLLEALLLLSLSLLLLLQTLLHLCGFELEMLLVLLLLPLLDLREFALVPLLLAVADGVLAPAREVSEAELLLHSLPALFSLVVPSLVSSGA